MVDPNLPPPPPPYQQHATADDWTEVGSVATGSVIVQPHAPPHPVGAPPPAPAAPLDASAALQIDVKRVPSAPNTLLVSLTPPAAPASGTRPPVDLVCVLDVSGSMDTAADIKQLDAAGNTVAEDSGLTVLDVCKHALRTVVAGLEEGDRLAIVTFSNEGKVKFPLASMDQQGRDNATTAAMKLQTEGMTNLWAGLKTGLDVLKKAQAGTVGEQRNAGLFLLTDGQPNVSPPRGEVAMLQRYMDENQLRAAVNFFGFGYGTNASLLADLAVQGNGVYSFIPDAGMVGTIFVHATANLLATMAAQCVLTIDRALDAAHTPYPHMAADWGTTLQLGSVMYGQPRNLVLHVTPGGTGGADADAPVDVAVTMTHHAARDRATARRSGLASVDASPDAARDARYHGVRQTLVARARAILAKAAANQASGAEPSTHPDSLKLVAAELGVAALGAADARLADMLKDCADQMALALDAQYFAQWGRDYLLSITGAHLAQQCNNFKDAGVQHYGGALFAAQRDRMDSLFNELPAMKPSRAQRFDRTTNSYVASAPVAMASYNRCAGPCFAGDALVHLAGGARKRADAVVRGDVLDNGATVAAVLRTRIAPRAGLVLCALSPTVRVTPWHPVLDSHTREWTFPAHLAPAHPAPEVEFIYSFALDTLHTLTIGGLAFVGLGHGFTDAVRAHAYFGSRAVVEDMARLPGFAEHDGVVTVVGVRRDEATGLVCGLVAGDEAVEEERPRQALVDGGAEPVVAC